MVKFPNSSFHKYTYPQNYCLRISQFNKLFSHKNYFQFNNHEPYDTTSNENLNDIREKIPH